MLSPDCLSLSLSLIWEVTDSPGFRELPKSTFPVLWFYQLAMYGLGIQTQFLMPGNKYTTTEPTPGSQKANLATLSAINLKSAVNTQKQPWVMWKPMDLPWLAWNCIYRSGQCRLAWRPQDCSQCGQTQAHWLYSPPVFFFFYFGGLDSYFSFLYLTM